MFRYLCIYVFSLIATVHAANVTFDDGSSFDLNDVTLPASEIVNATNVCASFADWRPFCAACGAYADEQVASLQDDAVHYSLQMVMCVYTIGGFYGISAALRANGGQNLSSDLKAPILLAAAALTWVRSRTRQFTDRRASIVFRGEPNLPVDDCWFNASLPAYEPLSSNVTEWPFTSTSLSAQFPLIFMHLAQPNATATRVLVIQRNTSSSQSGSYLWPIPTALASEVTYAPGNFFYHLACRRERVPSFVPGVPAVDVAYTLMYEATTSNGRRLSVATERHIEKKLNAAIDAWSGMCVPYLCAWASTAFWPWPSVFSNTMPSLFACVDNATNKTAPSAVSFPHRVVPNATVSGAILLINVLFIYF